jgi:hypothetical protein
VPQARNGSFVGLVFLSMFRGAGKVLKAVKEIDLWSEPLEEADIYHGHTHGMLRMVFSLLSSGLKCGWFTTAASGCMSEFFSSSAVLNISHSFICSGC